MSSVLVCIYESETGAPGQLTAAAASVTVTVSVAVSVTVAITVSLPGARAPPSLVRRRLARPRSITVLFAPGEARVHFGRAAARTAQAAA